MQIKINVVFVINIKSKYETYHLLDKYTDKLNMQQVEWEQAETFKLPSNLSLSALQYCFYLQFNVVLFCSLKKSLYVLVIQFNSFFLLALLNKNYIIHKPKLWLQLYTCDPLLTCSTHFNNTYLNNTKSTKLCQWLSEVVIMQFFRLNVFA